jgi:hypothetical protein
MPFLKVSALPAIAHNFKFSNTLYKINQPMFRYNLLIIKTQFVLA